MKDTKPHINICPDCARIASVTSDIVQKASLKTAPIFSKMRARQFSRHTA